MRTPTATPATTTMPALIAELLSSGDAARCGLLYGWVVDQDAEALRRDHGLPREALLTLLADVAFV